MINISRKTKETDIELSLEVYGEGKYNIQTKVGFFKHMLESFSKHSRVNLELKCEGDLEVDYHHCVEDVGIVLGEAFYKEVFPPQEIERFADCKVVMDEACVCCAVDISNRPFLFFDLDIDGKVGEFDTELVEEFFRAFCYNAKITLHIWQERGKNKHHIIEAAFKALALCLRKALKKDSSLGILSTKGVI